MKRTELHRRLSLLNPRVNAQASLKARIAGGFYLLNFVTGSLALFFASHKLTGASNAYNLVATVCYVVVTLLFYELFKPVNRSVAFIASCFSLVGCALSLPFPFIPHPVSNLVLFGVYCLMTGYLILRSYFLPGVLGILMMIGGLGWLTFLSPALVHRLTPYNMAPAIAAEGALTLWLLIAGVNAERWNDQARLSSLSRS